MEPDEHDIIRQVRDGDTAAYAALVEKYQARVLRLCTALLRNASDAEDAAQEIFLKAYQALGQFRQGAAFYTWLYRIASNHCLTLLRSKARRPSESWDALLEKDGEAAQALLAGPDPKRSAESADLAERLLAGLSADHRMVLTLREAEGLSYDEMARVLGCSPDAVKARLRRARREIEERMRHFSSPKGV